MKVYYLLLENIEGENSVELYSTYEKACVAFNNYIKEYRNRSEFEVAVSGDVMAWANPFDERLSFISLMEDEVH